MDTTFDIWVADRRIFRRARPIVRIPAKKSAA
jgi:hypothetical protein